MQVIVLAAGQGTRMRPLSDSVPKPMLPVGGQSLLGNVLQAAAEAGADDFIVVTGYEGQSIRSELGEAFAGCPITYCEQETTNGTAAAVSSASTHVTDDFAVLNGDCLYRESDLEKLFATGPAIGITRVESPQDYGVVSLENGSVSDIIEKPAEPPTSYANTGAYVFPRDSLGLLDVEESDRGEYELTDAVGRLLDRQSMAAVHFEGWRDIGYPWDLLSANESILATQERRIDGSVHEAASIGDNVVIEAGATVDAGVRIDGPVLVRSGASVGPNAYIRGATVIGEGVTVGHGVEIKNSLLMADTAVPHLSYVGDSVLGERVNLGAGTQIANVRHDREPITVRVNGDRIPTGRVKFGAVIGNDVSTGINTSLNPGIKLSSGTTTAPGETVTRDR